MSTPTCNVCGDVLMPSHPVHDGCQDPEKAARHAPGEAVRLYTTWRERVEAVVWVWDPRFAWWKVYTEKVFVREHGKPPDPNGNYGTVWYEHSGWSDRCLARYHDTCAAEAMLGHDDVHTTRRDAFLAVQAGLHKQLAGLMERYEDTSRLIWRNLNDLAEAVREGR